MQNQLSNQDDKNDGDTDLSKNHLKAPKYLGVIALYVPLVCKIDIIGNTEIIIRNLNLCYPIRNQH